MAELQVMSGLVVERAFEKHILPGWRGGGVRMEWAPTKLLMDAIGSGRTADIALLTQEAITELADEGVVLAGSVTPLVASSIGIGTSADHHLPRLDALDDFRAFLSRAGSLAYSQTGASGSHFRDILNRLGIAASVADKLVAVSAGFAGEAVTSGRAQFAVQQISELLSVPGIVHIHKIPEAIQPDLKFSAAIFSRSGRKVEARRFLDHIAGPEAGLAYEREGLQPLFRGVAQEKTWA